MISGKRKVAYLGFGISLAVIVALFVAGLIKTATYNRQVHYAAYQGQELFSAESTREEDVSVKAGVRNSTWTKVFDLRNEGLTDHNYQAFTYDFYLSNNTKDEVDYFSFRLTFGKDVFLSSAWNGSLEIPQNTGAGDIVDLLQYGEDTAGGHMSTEMIVVQENMSMPDCIKAMRQQAEDIDEIYVIYVVDDDNRLKGIFPLKTTITNPSASKIKHVMEPDPLSVRTDTHIEDVALDFEKYDLVAMPVVDSIGRLVGRITVDDIIDRVREQGEDNYQMASGIWGDIESDDNVFRQVRARLPWLLIGLVGGIINALILGGGEGDADLLRVLPGLALFIPLIGGTGGNVGTQSSAIVVQGLANGSLDIKHVGKHLFKEFSTALINALVMGLLIFLYTRFFPVDDDPTKSNIATAAVTTSLFLVVMFASLFGTVVPLVLERLKIDPAIATGPFVTVTNDIVGITIYMAISGWLINVFTSLMG